MPSDLPALKLRCPQKDRKKTASKVIVSLVQTIISAGRLECRKVVDALSAKGVSVVALVRDTAAAAKVLPFNSNISIVRGDVYQYGTVSRAMAGCDGVICTTGATDIRDPFGPFNVDYQVCSSFPMGQRTFPPALLGR